MLKHTMWSFWSSFRACLFPGSSFSTSWKSGKDKYPQTQCEPAQIWFQNKRIHAVSVQHLAWPPASSLKPLWLWHDGQKPWSRCCPEKWLWCSRPLPRDTCSKFFFFFFTLHITHEQKPFHSPRRKKNTEKYMCCAYFSNFRKAMALFAGRRTFVLSASIPRL